MKKTIILIALAALVFCLAACGENAPSGESGAVSDAEEFVKPDKSGLSDGDRALTDAYYAKLLEERPDLAAIPRDMLSEYVFRSEGEVISVEFTFCYGGYPTKCSFSYRFSDKYPDGRLKVEEDDFKQYYQSGLTKEQVADIKTKLCSAINDKVAANKLAECGLTSETIGLDWEKFEGRLCAVSEYIANVTEQTTGSYGCGDHAHILARVYLDDMSVQSWAS